jgi:DNA-binding transcriptional regulator YiaG
MTDIAVSTSDHPTFRRGRRVVVPLWTSAEIWRLRTAKRITVRGFAGWLGVSDRMVSKWEAGTVPSPTNQEVLDEALARLSPAEMARFRARPERSPRQRTPEAEPARVDVPTAVPATVRQQQLLAELWESDDMRTALGAHDIAFLFGTLQRHGISQRRIAAMVGIAQSEVCEILAGAPGWPVRGAGARRA